MSTPHDRPRGPAQADYATRRRALIRRHHPDVGGDADVLHAELARLDREFAMRRIRASTAGRGAPGDGCATPFVVSRTPRWKRLRRRAVRGIALARTRLPRSIPGSRRYFDI